MPRPSAAAPLIGRWTAWLLGLALLANPVAAGAAVLDDLGCFLEPPARPARIVALTPALTETLFSLGVGSQVVGAVDYADHPPEALSLLRVGSYTALDVERVVALAPDLVLASRDGNPAQVVEQLCAAGVPVYVTATDDPRKLPEGLARLGAVCGATEEGRALAERMRARFAEVARTLKGAPVRPTLMVINREPLVSVGQGTIHHRLIEMAHGSNLGAAVSGRWPRLSLEYVLAARPQVVVLSTMKRGADREANLAYLRGLPGVGDQPGVRVVAISSDLLDRPGPRLAEGLLALARAIHPERFGPIEERP